MGMLIFLGHFELLDSLRLSNLDNVDDLWNFALYLIFGHWWMNFYFSFSIGMKLWEFDV